MEVAEVQYRSCFWEAYSKESLVHFLLIIYNKIKLEIRILTPGILVY